RRPAGQRVHRQGPHGAWAADRAGRPHRAAPGRRRQPLRDGHRRTGAVSAGAQGRGRRDRGRGEDAGLRQPRRRAQAARGCLHAAAGGRARRQRGVRRPDHLPGRDRLLHRRTRGRQERHAGQSQRTGPGGDPATLDRRGGRRGRTDAPLPALAAGTGTRPRATRVQGRLMWADEERNRLEGRSLMKVYNCRKVVEDVSLVVESGEVVGLLGPNGAGKTTCFYMIVGLVPADGGTIELDGRPIGRLPIHRRARLGLSYLPPEASAFRKLTVEENITAVLELQVDENGRPLSRKAIEQRRDELITELQIDHIRSNPALSLSGGERRRVEIARA